MDIVGGAYGGSSPKGEIRAELHSARSSLEEALGNWQGLEEAQRLERLGLSLLSLHRLEMTLDALESSNRLNDALEAPNLVDLRFGEQNATARLMPVAGEDRLV